MIDNIYGKKKANIITCDNCGKAFEAENWEEARETMNQDGWKTRKVDSEWVQFCDECDDAR